MRPAMQRAAAALGPFGAQQPNEAQISELAAAFEALGEDVQTQCQFPLQ
jgi:hypothetical protein